MIRVNGTSNVVILLTASLLAACAGSSGEADVAPPTSPSSDANVSTATSTPRPEQPAGAVATAIDELGAAARVDLSPTGNRVIDGPGALLDVEPLVTEALGADTTVVWIAPTGPSDWLVVSSDGSADVISTASGEATVEPIDIGSFDPSSGPPIVTTTANATLVEGHDVRRSFFADPLPDTRVTTDGAQLVAIGGPTDRYAHGVLGDVLEGSTIEVVGVDGVGRTPVTIDGPDVFEAVSPMLADVDGDGPPTP